MTAYLHPGLIRLYDLRPRNRSGHILTIPEPARGLIMLLLLVPILYKHEYCFIALLEFLNFIFFLFLPPANAAVNAFGRFCLSVYVDLCVCPVWALSFESFDLEILLLAHRCVFRSSTSRSSMKVMGPRSRSYKRS